MLGRLEWGLLGLEMESGEKTEGALGEISCWLPQPRLERVCPWVVGPARPQVYGCAYAEMGAVAEWY